MHQIQLRDHRIARTGAAIHGHLRSGESVLHVCCRIDANRLQRLAHVGGVENQDVDFGIERCRAIQGMGFRVRRDVWAGRRARRKDNIVFRAERSRFIDVTGQAGTAGCGLDSIVSAEARNRRAELVRFRA